MEYALYSGIVVDRRMDSHGVTLDRMSIKIRETTLCSQGDVAKALSFRGVNGTCVLMENWRYRLNQFKQNLPIPEYWNLVHLSFSRFLFSRRGADSHL